ncbi:MAG: CotH kinase family protein, partial [Mariniblastus sp.]|nr:CotH kinase family protein [Mariniblastus sp.]
MKKICIGFCFVVFTLIVIKLGALQAVLGFQDGPPVDLLTQGLDRNGDARLSASEIKDAPSVLGSLDKNRDGRLTVEEIFPPMNRPQDRRRSGPGPGMGPGGPGGMPQRDLIGEFDVDKNNRLEGEELKLALESVADQPPQRRGPKRRPRGRETVKPSQPGREISKESVVNFPNLPLYDATILRTVFIDIESDQWEKDMASLKDYGVDIEATVTVDQQAYEKVGLRFRGNSSFFSLGNGQKRSLNLTFDWADKKQNLYGYRTLNLLNSHSDASFLRLVLYSRIAQDYIPVPKANYVHVVINGESWGVYINEQQFNSDFTKEHFDSKGGRRWKAPPGREGASFTYKGDQSDAYRTYELKTKDTPESWDALINATKMMEQTDSEDFESTLDKAICIDRILWFLAIDNVMLDMDGYYQRGADYSIYQEPKFKRFHILPYDNNETFRAQGSHGPGFGGGPPGAGPGRGGLLGGLFGGGPPQGGPPQG